MIDALDHCGFIPSAEVTSPDELFGRNESGRELEKILTSVVLSHCNPQVIAERRSGKSSLLTCARSRLRSGKLEGGIIGALVNFKKRAISGDVNAGYTWLCSCLLAESSRLPIWTREGYFEVASGRRIPRCNSADDYSDFILASNWKGERMFENIVVRFAREGLSTILLIDEYEAMYFISFGGKIGSVHTIRDLAMTSLENGQRFQCAVAGARPWDFYAKDIGSDDFNFIDDHVFLRPLTVDDARKLLQYGYEQSSGRPKAFIKSWLDKSAEMRDLSGGWPYILKVLANEIARTGNIDVNAVQARLSPHFSNIWNRLPDEYKSTLKGYQADQRVQRHLVNWALAEYTAGGTIVPSGGLWQGFLSEVNIDKDRVAVDSESNQDAKELQVYHLGVETTDLIAEINETLNGKSLPVVFNTTISVAYPKRFKNIGIVVRDETGFQTFISSIYLILFESTQNDLDTKKKSRVVNLARIPDIFSRNHSKEPDVFHRIDMLRHKFTGAHDTLSRNFVRRRFTPEECQEHYVGHRNHPTAEEFYVMQIGILKEFNLFLIDLLKWAESQQAVK